METLERLSQRIETVEEVRSIVHTMKTLSAVNLRQFESAATVQNGYDHTNRLGLTALASGHPALLAPSLGQTSKTAVTLVLIGPERGLCGRFADRLLESRPDSDQTLIVGHRMNAVQAGTIPDPAAIYPLASSIHGIGDLVDKLNATLETLNSPKTDQIIKVHAMRRTGSGALEPTTEQIWPIDAARLNTLRLARWPSKRLPGPYGNMAKIWTGLLRQRLMIDLHSACLGTMIAESSARFTAMQAAEENISDRLAALQQSQRLRRQSDITTELIDIWSGFELSEEFTIR